MQNTPDVKGFVPRNIEEYRSRNDPEAVKAVAREMESLFAYEMLKVMRETVGASSKGTLGQDSYMSMFDMEISKLFAQRGLGLQDMLAKSIKHLAEKSGKSPAQQVKPVLHRTHAEQSLNEGIKGLLPEVDDPKVSSNYGLRNDPFSNKTAFHHGLDIAAPSGADIHPISTGTVVFSGKMQGYGNLVVIDHGDGFQSKYAHNRENLVQQGQVVDTGSVIAQVGDTGRSTGPHLHFELLHEGKAVDPHALLDSVKVKDSIASADKKNTNLASS